MSQLAYRNRTEETETAVLGQEKSTKTKPEMGMVEPTQPYIRQNLVCTVYRVGGLGFRVMVSFRVRVSIRSGLGLE